ncbi:DUF2642 domain-containing protein [Ectobacillus sp. sgz5001026]|uniref:DUF2642 domain-containing protein n=1 Tax=Ectobacillus sp. sgz5001026 TaxID=3242473 RepID=UPI0036D2A32C
MSIASLRGKQIDVEISGKVLFQGILIEQSKEIVVLFDGKNFMYFPLLHIHRINESAVPNGEITNPSVGSLVKNDQSISFQTILENAKGRFTEIYVTGDISLHGYIVSVQEDYLYFYSHVFNMMLLSTHHLKWLIPYHLKTIPYTLSDEKIPTVPSTIPLHALFEEQIKKYENELVVFDMGGKSTKIGLLKKVNEGIIELVVANGDTVYITVAHIQSVHIPG